MHKLESHKDELNSTSVLIASDLGDKDILQEPEPFLMELDTHIPGPGVRDREGKFRRRREQ